MSDFIQLLDGAKSAASAELMRAELSERLMYCDVIAKLEDAIVIAKRIRYARTTRVVFAEGLDDASCILVKQAASR